MFTLQAVCFNQTWVKYIIVLDSNTFLCSIDLAWCNSVNQEDQKVRIALGSNTPESSVMCRTVSETKTMNFVSGFAPAYHKKKKNLVCPILQT